MLLLHKKSLDMDGMFVKWQKSKLFFDPDQPIDRSWFVDAHEIMLGAANEGHLFDQAVDLLFAYDFYSPKLITYEADFISQNRKLRMGDRIIQRISLVPGILDVLAMNIVVGTLFEPNRCGFTIQTSDKHYEIGELTATVVRKSTGDVVLMFHAVSKFSNRVPWFARNFARRLQIQAHGSIPDHFKSRLYKRKQTK